jgi:cell division protein FtsI/penicillin-binding protein 2
VSSGTRVICEGVLDPNKPKSFRCDSIHNEIDPISAIQKSCNIFFYKTGESMGTDLLSFWMSQFGLGRSTGIGLPNEAVGHLPTTPYPGLARMAGIGQGEVDMTPLQAANMFATLASGVYRPVSIWADNPAPRPATRLEISDEAWRMVREGMYRVVNQEHGTAYEYGRLVDAGDYILMGKTGTAQVPRRPMQRMFTCRLPDGTVKEEAGASRLAMQHKYPGAEISGGRPLQVTPPAEVEDPVDSWFTGYLTSKKHYLDSNNGGDLHVAIAIVIEYGEHGGRTAAPVARDMMRALIDRQSTSAPATPQGAQR